MLTAGADSKERVNIKQDVWIVNGAHAPRECSKLSCIPFWLSIASLDARVGDTADFQQHQHANREHVSCL